MGAYVRLVGSLAQNLARRVGEDLADCAAVCKRGVLYKIRSIRLRYDDVGPGSAGSQDWQIQPEQLALLVESVQHKPWFCELDRRTAEALVHDGGPGCFLIRPSASTKSLTLILWYHHRSYNILLRQREDGLLALGSKKDQEMTFHSVEEMVRYFEREPLILYSGGEMTGKTRLKAPPPGLVTKNVSASSSSELTESSRAESRRCSSSAGIRRFSEGTEEAQRQTIVYSRTLSSENCVPFSSSISRRLAVSTPNIEHVKVLPPSTSPRRLSSEALPDKVNYSQPPLIILPRLTHSGISPEEILNCSTLSCPIVPCSQKVETRNSPVPKRPPVSFLNVPGKGVPSLSLSVSNTPSYESTCL